MHTFSVADLSSCCFAPCYFVVEPISRAISSRSVCRVMFWRCCFDGSCYDVCFIDRAVLSCEVLSCAVLSSSLSFRLKQNNEKAKRNKSREMHFLLIFVPVNEKCEVPITCVHQEGTKIYSLLLRAACYPWVLPGSAYGCVIVCCIAQVGIMNSSDSCKVLPCDYVRR